MPPAVALGQDEVAALGQELAELFDGDAPPLDEPASPGEPAPPDEPVSLDESSSPDESGPPEAPASSATAPAATEGEPPGPVSTQGDDLAPCVPADLGDPADLEPAPVAPAEAAVEVPVGDALSALPATSEIGNLAGDSDIPAPDAATAPAGVAVARLGNGDQELADLVGDLTSGAPESERLEAADAPPPPGSAAAANGGPVPAVPTPTLARLYAEQGFADRAASVYRQVLQARPDDEEARLALAGLEGPR